MPTTDEVALLAAIRANPADEGAWRAYGDHLLARGDARGQLIILDQRDRAAPGAAEAIEIECLLALAAEHGFPARAAADPAWAPVPGRLRLPDHERWYALWARFRPAMQGVWVTVEDLYDRDRNSFGPFPVAAVAHLYCDAYNGESLDYRLKVPQFLGSVATAPGYDLDARVSYLTAHRDEVPAAAEVLAAQYDAADERAWRSRRLAQVPLDGCWCAALARGEVPEVEGDVLAAYMARGLRSGASILETPQHFGGVSHATCGTCGAAFLHLLVEHEGYGNCIHHYYAPVDPAMAAALAAGAVAPATVEAWFEARPGVHVDHGRATCYRGVTVGYAGFDHRLR